MPLDPNRWTLKTQEALADAQQLAIAAGHPEVTPEHLLVAALSQDGGVAIPILSKLGETPVAVRNRLSNALDKLPKTYGGGEPEMSRELLTGFRSAQQAQKDMGDE